MDDTARRFPRAPVAVEIEYRTSTAFLVAYSLNLSKGGVFIDTQTPLPTGTTIALKFQVAGAAHPIETEGAVIWVRDQATPDGPAGMGVAFVQLEPRYGQVIDSIVSRFDGVTMLIASTIPSTRTLVGRYLRGMMSCQVLEVSSPSELPLTASRLDLAVGDFAQTPEFAEQVFLAARGISAELPLIALAPVTDPALKTRAQGAGAFDVLASPPPYNDLYRSVLGAFAQLVRLRQSQAT